MRLKKQVIKFEDGSYFYGFKCQTIVLSGGRLDDAKKFTKKDELKLEYMGYKFKKVFIECVYEEIEN